MLIKVAPQLRGRSEAELVSLLKQGLARVDGDSIVPTISGRANLLANNYEGGVQSDTISTGNSGGASGDAFNAVSIGSGNTLIFDGTNAQELLAAKHTFGGTATGYHGWSFTALTVKTWFRTYFAISAIPTVGTWFGPFRPVITDGSRSMSTGISTAGLLTFRNAADAIITALNPTIVTVLATDTVYRLEWSEVPSTTVGEIEWWLYDDPDAAIGNHVETKGPVGSLVLGAEIAGYRTGCQATAANVAGLSLWNDNIAISTDGQIGPEGGEPPPPSTIIPLRSRNVVRSR